MLESAAPRLPLFNCLECEFGGLAVIEPGWMPDPAGRQLILPNHGYTLHDDLVICHGPSLSLAGWSHQYCLEFLPACNLDNRSTSVFAGPKGLSCFSSC